MSEAKSFKTVKKPHAICGGCINFVWSGPYEYQCPPREGRKIEPFHRQNNRPIPNFKIGKNKQYQTVDFDPKRFYFYPLKCSRVKQLHEGEGQNLFERSELF